jgi:hypothetical protein
MAKPTWIYCGGEAGVNATEGTGRCLPGLALTMRRASTVERTGRSKATCFGVMDFPPVRRATTVGRTGSSMTSCLGVMGGLVVSSEDRASDTRDGGRESEVHEESRVWLGCVVLTGSHDVGWDERKL